MLSKETSAELEKWGADVIFGRAKGFRASLARAVMWALSYVFRALVLLRLRLFRKGWRQTAHVGTQVISIGNVTVGGTGKTPVTELLAKSLRDRGRKVAILSRGYKSKKLDAPQEWVSRRTGKLIEDPPKIVSEGGQMLMSSDFAGDEPFMLAKNLEGVAVVVDRDRVKGALFACAELDADTLLLDDGLQYLKLAHTLDLILIDSTRPFGTGSMLPRGTLREPRSNVRRASHILLTKCDGTPNDALIKKLRRWNPVADIIETAHISQYLKNVFTGERLELSALNGKFIAAISGIAVPESFEQKLTEQGATVLFHKPFPDHHSFSQREIDEFMERCMLRDAEMILTTEKDAVRFLKPTEIDVPIYYLRIEIEILRGQNAWDRLIDQIASQKSRGNDLIARLADPDLIL